MPTKPLSPSESRAAFASAGRVVAWGLGIYTATRIAAAVLETASLPAAVAQAVIAEWGVGRLGVAWSNPTAEVPTTSTIARRAGIGVAVGVVSAAVVVGFLATTRAVILDRASPAMTTALVALVSAGLYAMRDELLLHGLVLRALVTVDAPLAKVLACGVTSAAAAYGELGAAPSTIAVQGLLGIVFGALWVRDRGAWPAWGAHTAWLFATSALMQGGIFEAHVAATPWGGADRGPLGGYAAVVAVLPLAVGALAGTGRTPRAA
jgi:Type II CAAX prenyl endopeptidase Rce1-like